MSNLWYSDSDKESLTSKDTIRGMDLQWCRVFETTDKESGCSLCRTITLLRNCFMLRDAEHKTLRASQRSSATVATTEVAVRRRTHGIKSNSSFSPSGSLALRAVECSTVACQHEVMRDMIGPAKSKSSNGDGAPVPLTEGKIRTQCVTEYILYIIDCVAFLRNIQQQLL